MMLERITEAKAMRRGRRGAIDADALIDAAKIVQDVRERGQAAVREQAERFGERSAGEPLVLDRAAMEEALLSLDAGTRGVLERTAGRIEAFAREQRASISDLDVAIEGGRAGHTLVPIAAAGCYAPAGLHPLPSSVLMGAIPARVAGCERVVVASPGASPVMLAAAAIAGADRFLAVGGAHAIAAMAYGFDGFAPVDLIVGPGNAWVTAAKHLVSAEVGIDMLAGPSELLVLADETADAGLVAADLLAQAEHDPRARAMLVTTCAALADAVDRELRGQLFELPTAGVARAALAGGFACVVGSIEAALRVADAIAAEHVEVLTREADAVAGRLRHAGAVFIGPGSAEVFGDYGAGPNHTLPTGGGARWGGGLGVLDFLRVRTWLRMDAAPSVRGDAMAMARLEGLEGHRRAAGRRTADAAVR
jgi:phosphoribosyl-ATP pyrophosphohydrolase/phosphoribosyl-AMP cyclohydrolase/histidinol dehydrogenase